MLVDVHGHIGPSSSGPARPDDVARYAATCQLDKVLISNRDAASEPHAAPNLDEAAANLACLEACRADARLAPLYWVRPGQVDSNIHALRGALETEPFAAAVFAPAESGFDAAAPLLAPYLTVLARVGRPGLFCVSADERAAPAKVYEQARRHPELAVVLCVCGTDGPRAAALDVVRYAQRRADANLYVDTSHADAAEIVTAVRALGSARVLLGSDALRDGEAHAARVRVTLDALRNLLSPPEFRQVAGENALRLFRLAPVRA